jgi:hypothetical protein
MQLDFHHAVTYLIEKASAAPGHDRANVFSDALFLSWILQRSRGCERDAGEYVALTHRRLPARQQPRPTD